MKRSNAVSYVCLPLGLAAFALLGCTSSTGGHIETGTGGQTSPPSSGGASGGSQGSGGSVGSGGSIGSGGTTNSGGSVGTGGAGTGGATGTGGRVGSGGAPGTGGAPITGGQTGSGGATGNGGAGTGGRTGGTGGMGMTGGAIGSGGRGTGGTTGMGGTIAKGGTTGAGGTTSAGGTTGGTCAGTATPCPPTAANSIAYIGCSMADNIGQGYGQVGGKIMWTDANYGTGAMVVENWMEGGSAWPTFDAKLKAMGGIDTVKAFMVQICVLSTHSDANVRSMIKAARAKVNPGTHIYIVGQPQYEAGHTCSLAGTGGAEWTDTEAQAIAKDSTINQDLTYLGTFNLDTTKGESTDGCHASASGLTRLGNEAKAFWGG